MFSHLRNLCWLQLRDAGFFDGKLCTIFHISPKSVWACSKLPILLLFKCGTDAPLSASRMVEEVSRFCCYDLSSHISGLSLSCYN